MKKLILFILLLPSLCFAGSIQDAHKAVIARQTVASGGTTVVFQDDGGTTSAFNTYDAYMDTDNATTSYGATDSVDMGAAAAYDKRGIIAFPNMIGAGANQVPVGATITAASLSLETVSGDRNDNDTISMYRITRNWAPATNEENVDWDTYDGTNAWTAGGGDFDATPVASYAFAGDSVDPMVITTGLIAAIQAYADETHANYGWVLKYSSADGDSPYYKVYSQNVATPALRPKLTITYTE